MNFLAHSLLGFDQPALIAGQFCGDFVRGSDLSRFPPDVERGIRLHRYLDLFTDTHHVLKPVRQGINGVPRRLAGIVVDVMLDHYLARHWDQVSEVSLDRHAQSVHAALDAYQEHFPDSLKRFMHVLRSEELLQNNLRLDAIELTLARIAKRSPAVSALALDVEQLQPLREQLDAPLSLFFPELHSAAVSYLERPTRITP